MKTKFIKGSFKNKLILNLGKQPYADTFIKKSELKKKEPEFPLEVYMCKLSGIIQVGNKTKPFDRYNKYDYSYTSSNSEYSRNHWDNFCNNVLNFFKIKKKILIYEIGSNDGYLLKNFKKNGHKVMGIEASKFMTKLSNKKKINTIQKIFSFIESEKIKKKFDTCDLIIANNVLNHANDPLDFIKGVKNLLNKNGKFVFELPYWTETVKSKKFDQIYHEHVTYFTVFMAYNILKKNGFQITKISYNKYHGGSIRVFSKKSAKITLNKNIQKYIDYEKKYKIFENKTYTKLNDFIIKKKKIVHSKIKFFKKKGFKIAGIGAAAKANTLLNTFGLNYKHIDFMTDASKFKIGKYTPKSRIPIYKDEKLTKYEKICAILLSWNISSLLKKKLIQINKEIKFIEVFK